MDKSTYFVSFSPGLSQKLCRIICPMHKKKKDLRQETEVLFPYIIRLPTVRSSRCSVRSLKMRMRGSPDIRGAA